eukprot:767120-Hanusia_phi.AAC.2
MRQCHLAPGRRQGRAGRPRRAPGGPSSWHIRNSEGSSSDEGPAVSPITGVNWQGAASFRSDHPGRGGLDRLKTCHCLITHGDDSRLPVWHGAGPGSTASLVAETVCIIKSGAGNSGTIGEVLNDSNCHGLSNNRSSNSPPPHLQDCPCDWHPRQPPDGRYRTGRGEASLLSGTGRNGPAKTTTVWRSKEAVTDTIRPSHGLRGRGVQSLPPTFVCAQV